MGHTEISKTSKASPQLHRLLEQHEAPPMTETGSVGSTFTSSDMSNGPSSPRTEEIVAAPDCHSPRASLAQSVVASHHSSTSQSYATRSYGVDVPLAFDIPKTEGFSPPSSQKNLPKNDCSSDILVFQDDGVCPTKFLYKSIITIACDQDLQSTFDVHKELLASQSHYVTRLCEKSAEHAEQCAGFRLLRKEIKQLLKRDLSDFDDMEASKANRVINKCYESFPMANVQDEVTRLIDNVATAECKKQKRKPGIPGGSHRSTPAPQSFLQRLELLLPVGVYTVLKALDELLQKFKDKEADTIKGNPRIAGAHNKIFFPDLVPKVAQAWVLWLYTGKLHYETLSSSDLVGLFDLVQKLEMKIMEDECMGYLYEKLLDEAELMRKRTQALKQDYDTNPAREIDSRFPRGQAEPFGTLAAVLALRSDPRSDFRLLLLQELAVEALAWAENKSACNDLTHLFNEKLWQKLTDSLFDQLNYDKKERLQQSFRDRAKPIHDKWTKQIAARV